MTRGRRNFAPGGEIPSDSEVSQGDALRVGDVRQAARPALVVPPPTLPASSGAHVNSAADLPACGAERPLVLRAELYGQLVVDPPERKRTVVLHWREPLFGHVSDELPVDDQRGARVMPDLNAKKPPYLTSVPLIAG